MNSQEEHGGSPLEIEAVPTAGQYTRRRFVKRTGKTAVGAVLALAAFSVEQDAFAGGSSSTFYYVIAGYPGETFEDSANASFPDGHPTTIEAFATDDVETYSDDDNGPAGQPSGVMIISASVSPVPLTEIWAGADTSPETQPGQWIYGAEDSFSISFTFSVTTQFFFPASFRVTDGPSLTKSMTFTCTNDKNGLHPSVSGGGAPGDQPKIEERFTVQFNRTSAADSASFGATIFVSWDGKDVTGIDVCDPITASMTLSGSWSGVSFTTP